ncbi:MAG: VOC family protein [Candidatus Tectomicrobia bacterium]|uniref:VOC family protein n=1 Tax=Tectimicrobiota bacterium TaxID=2528274 RepID=A0A932I0F2_UNCTE|nr:VOC family protein [Candidatus Tectomicrobia bacterium]
MFEALSTVFLIGRDLAASRRFYSEILGLDEASVQRDHVRYKIGEAFLVVHAPIPDKEMRAWNLEPLREPRGSGVVLTLRPADVDAAHAALRERGADILFPPRDAPWGVRLFMVRDPDGFLIEVSRPIS